MDDGALPSRWAEYERRVPSSLEDLRGQATGLVDCTMDCGYSRRYHGDLGKQSQIGLSAVWDQLGNVVVQLGQCLVECGEPGPACSREMR